MVITQAPKMEKLRVQEALFLILGQDHKAAVSLDRDRRPAPGRPFRRGNYVAADDEPGDYDDQLDYDEGFYEAEEGDNVYYDGGWADEPHFDAQAAYYEASETEFVDEEFDVDTYDEAYAAYLDARRRFQDLKLSRGFLPIVALADQSGTASGSQSPIPPGRGKGFGGKSKGGKGRGKGKNIVKYQKPGGKSADPRGRAAAVLQCIRCGATGHQAAQCPRPAKHSTPAPTPSSPAKKTHVESMAMAHPPSEQGLVIFEDSRGRPRVDCTMLDPGASAFLMGSGPFRRYIGHLQELGYPVSSIEMQKTHRTFHFGGDHSTLCQWVAKIPMFVNHVFGFVQAFLIKGETPMLMGRPIIEALGIVVNFRQRTMMFEGHPWRPITMGLHGEYLLSLTEDFDLELLGQVPSFDLFLHDQPAATATSSNVLSIDDYYEAEGIFVTTEATIGERPLLLKHWKTFDHALSSAENEVQNQLTRELKALQPRTESCLGSLCWCCSAFSSCRDSWLLHRGFWS